MNEMPPRDPSSAAHLLSDLETRQDELLRLLSELEDRTRQALAQFGGIAGDKSPAEPGAREPVKKAA